MIRIKFGKHFQQSPQVQKSSHPKIIKSKLGKDFHQSPREQKQHEQAYFQCEDCKSTLKCRKSM